MCIYSSPSSILVENFEILLHDRFGDSNYWGSRYSMVYAAALRQAGNRFTSETLGYQVAEGATGRDSASNGGGHYISAHLRRYVNVLSMFCFCVSCLVVRTLGAFPLHITCTHAHTRHICGGMYWKYIHSPVHPYTPTYTHTLQTGLSLCSQRCSTIAGRSC